MQPGKRFKWSTENYSLREFIEQFSYRLPVTIYITEGWMGRDEDHTFSSDEVGVYVDSVSVLAVFLPVNNNTFNC